MATLKGHKPIKEYYEQEDVASKYIDSRFANPSGRIQHIAHVKFIQSALEEYDVKRVLEIAPGPARLSKFIKVNGLMIAVDRSMAMLKQAKEAINNCGKKSDWAFILSDAFSLPFKEKSFDCIYSFRFFRHFDFEDRKKLFSECHRVLKDSGILIFDMDNKNVVGRLRKKAGMVEPPIYDELFTSDELKDEATKNNFKQITIKGSYHCPQFLRTLDRFKKFGLGNAAFVCGTISNKIIKINPMEWLVIWRKF